MRHKKRKLAISGDFPGGLDSKASVYNGGDLSSIPGSGRSPGEGNGNPLQLLVWIFMVFDYPTSMSHLSGNSSNFALKNQVSEMMWLKWGRRQPCPHRFRICSGVSTRPAPIFSDQPRLECTSQGHTAWMSTRLQQVLPGKKNTEQSLTVPSP